VIGTIGTIIVARMTGAAYRSVTEGGEGRYAATAGSAINANFLAALVGMAFLAAIYLLARDRSLLWRCVYIIALLVFPVMLIRIGSRGNLVALAVSLLLPFLFVRQIMRRPGLALMLMAIILLTLIAAGLIMKSGGLSEGVSSRLTDVERAKSAIAIRMEPIRKAVHLGFRKPLGTSYYGWFEQTGLRIWPHSDFFLILGVYGFPGAVLFALLVIAMIRTVMRTPMGLEKLYTRAVLAYLLVVGMNNANVYKKFYWVFFAMILAGYKIALLRAGRTEPHAQPEAALEEYDEQLHGVMPAY
jgi:O-antigen ligase